jgi:hypothetical protein
VTTEDLKVRLADWTAQNPTTVAEARQSLQALREIGGVIAETMLANPADRTRWVSPELTAKVFGMVKKGLSIWAVNGYEAITLAHMARGGRPDHLDEAA